MADTPETPQRARRKVLDEPRWYAVHTRPRLEHKAAIRLEQKGFDTFYPFLRERRYQGRTRLCVDCDRPLFSRYIFVGLHHRSQGLYAVNETYEVSTVVYLGGEPLQIPNAVMDELMERTDDGGMVIREKPVHWFKGKPGDRIEMKDEAPFYGLITQLASIEGLDLRDEICIWLEMLGKRQTITVPARAVAKVLAA